MWPWLRDSSDELNTREAKDENPAIISFPLWWWDGIKRFESKTEKLG